MDEEHICEVCNLPAGEHTEDCIIVGCNGHWPPLCCPGCPCESFEDVHPEHGRRGSMVEKIDALIDRTFGAYLRKEQRGASPDSD